MPSSGMTADTAMGAIDTASGSALSSADKDFVTKTGMLNNYELKSAELARSMSKNAQYKSYADQIIKDHTKVGGELKAAVAKADPSVQLPAEVDPKSQARLDALQNAGNGFDAKYKQQMVESHQEIHTSFSDYIKRPGANQGVKTVISGAQPAVEMHLSMAKKLPSR